MRLDRKWEWLGDGEFCDNYKDPRIKFEFDDVKTILGRISNKEPQWKIALDYGVHQVAISNINIRKGKWLQDEKYDNLFRNVA